MIEVVCAIISKNGKVLAAQNSPESDHPLKWEFPGGKIKPGETGEEAIIREIDEELCLEILIVKKMESISFDYGFRQIHLIPFFCSISTGTLQLNEHIQASWFNWEELQKLNFSEADMEILNSAKNKKFLLKQMRENMDYSG